MNILLKIGMLSCILFYLPDLMGQTLFRPGYVITNGNDTLKGLIDYRGDLRNSKKCDFKTDQSSTVQEFTPQTIKGYRFIDGKYYISKTIKSDGQEIRIFLEFLVNGISDLYYYGDATSNHYFIEKSDGQLIELTNEQRKITVDGIDYQRESKTYIGLLKYAFADCPQIFPLINRAVLEDKSLINITKKYHEYKCDGEKCIIYEKQLPAVRILFAPFVSMSALFLHFGASATYENIHFNTVGSPSVGFMLNTSLPKMNEKISFQTSIEFEKNYFYGKGTGSDVTYFDEVHLHTTSCKFKGGFKYTWPKGKLRPTLLAGANFDRFFKSEGRRIEESTFSSAVYTYEYNDLKMPDFLIGYHAELGFDYQVSDSRMMFVNLCFGNTMNSNSFMSKYSYTANLKTIQIYAGIYF